MPYQATWLAGSNKKVQAYCWEMCQQSGWKRSCKPKTTQSAYSVLKYTLVERHDLLDLRSLTAQVKNVTRGYIRDIKDFPDCAEGHYKAGGAHQLFYLDKYGMG